MKWGTRRKDRLVAAKARMGQVEFDEEPAGKCLLLH